MATTTKNVNAEEIENVNVENEVNDANEGTATVGVDRDAIIAKIMKANDKNKKYSKLLIKNVNVKLESNYTRISLTLNKSIPGMVADKSGNFSEGSNNIIFTSAYALGALLVEDEDFAIVKNDVVKEPENDLQAKQLDMMLRKLFIGSEITILQEFVQAGDTYKNPWSTRTDAEPIEIQNTTYFNHIIKCEFSNKARTFIDNYAMNLLLKA